MIRQMVANMVKDGTHSKEEGQRILDRYLESEARELVNKVSARLDRLIEERPTPPTLILNDAEFGIKTDDEKPKERTWVHNGSWWICRWKVNSMRVLIELYAVWKAENVPQTSHYRKSPRIPSGYQGAKFRLPHGFQAEIELEDAPTTAGGWVTGATPEVPEDVLVFFRKLFREELAKKAYLVGSNNSE